MGEKNNQLPFSGKIYVFAVVAAGAVVICHSFYRVLVDPPDHSWLILAAFTLLSGTLTIRVPTITATISVSEMFVFTAVLLYGGAPATLIVALDGMILSVSSAIKRPYRLLFNIAEPSFSIWIASLVFFIAAGVSPLSRAHFTPDVLPLLTPIALLATTYFLLNSSLTAVAIGIEQRKHPFVLWRKHFVWLSLNYLGGASVAVLLVRNSASGAGLDPFGFAAIVPLLFISYLTHKYSMGRLEDATRHITKLNSLYLSTIETLAMAIDAKDQITHGHIRRVQMYAVRLAKSLGVTEEMHLKAIEAAALLHDTGKLAVPEYILNKPGKLTSSEFEKMKLHAAVGADILSSIDFPYPVVPIVRHHHENWDGTGYPAGLKGIDIPIGARILSVVDCFDALTSDRPYRPKLPDDEAIRILVERRATMYDPLVVDTFLKVHTQIGQTQGEEHPTNSGLHHISRSVESRSELFPPTGFNDGSASSDEMLTLYDLARALGGRATLADAGDIIAKHLRRVLPASLCVFYVYDQAADELVAAHVTPDTLPIVGLRIGMGEGIAGWVGANRQIIINSEPVLDLGELATSNQGHLRSCLSAPLVIDDSLVGVLSVFSPSRMAYDNDHRRMAEAVSRQVSRVVRDAVEFERYDSTCRDQVTGLPNIERLKRLTPWDVGLPAERGGTPLSLVFIKVVEPDTGQDVDSAFDAVLSHVATVLRRALRVADILFRYQPDEFVVLLSRTDCSTAEAVADRLRLALTASPCLVSAGKDAAVEYTIGVATHSSGGETLADLVDLARQRVLSPVSRTLSIARGIH